VRINHSPAAVKEERNSFKDVHWPVRVGKGEEE
jgi:hypothetical protein